MRSFVASLLAIFFFSNTAAAQDYTVEYTYADGYSLVYKGTSDKLYGLINDDQKIVIPLEYKKIRPLGEKGIYEVKNKASKAGMYSVPQQKLILDPQFYEIENFSEGLAVVKKSRADYGFLWGAVDVNGRIIIPVEYDYLGGMQDGMINFKKDKKFGFVDKTNKVIIPAVYEDFSAFSEGLAAVKNSEGKYGYIDKSNNMVIAPAYEDANPFFSGYATVAKKKGYSMGGAGKQTVTVPGEWLLINKKGTVIQQRAFEKISNRQGGGLFIIEQGGKKGVMDSTGQPILPIGYDQVDIDKNGYIIFKLDGKFGMMSSRGSSVLQPKYDYVSHTNYARYYARLNGKYQVGDMNGNVFIPGDSANAVILGKKRIVYLYDDKVKVYDLNGNPQKTFTDLNLRNYGHSLSVTEDSIKLNGDATAQMINLLSNTKKSLPFGEAGDFNEEGIFVGKRANKYDFYDYTGKKLNTESYYSVVNFSEGIAALQLSSTSAPYLADKNFNKIKDLYLYFKGPYSEGVAYASSGQSGTVHYLDKKGYEVFSVKARQGSKCINGFIIIKENSSMYYVNKTGKRIGTRSWDDANEFSEGLALVKSNGKYGFIDTLGNTVIELKYDLASSFSKGAAMVKQNNKFFLINKKGEPINNIKYDNAGNPGNGTFPVQKDNLAGLIDSRGNQVIDFKYNSILYMSEDRVWAAKNGKWGLLDNKGKELTDFIYQGAYDFEGGYARIVQNDKIGVINKAGKIILPAEFKSLSSIYKNSVMVIRPAETLYFNLK